MPYIPERQNKDDSKEIRLFGEKSIREEAYRQKIIELEKEIMKLESVLKNQESPVDKANSNKVADNLKANDLLPEYSEGIFYEAAASLDEKVKKYHRMLEVRARNISDRLNMQAQNLIEGDKIHEHVITTKRVLIILALFTIIAVAMAGFSIFTFYRIDQNLKQGVGVASNSYESPENIKALLQKSGFYNNQYTIVSLNNYNRIYKGMVELHFNPHNKWTLKMVASDIVENFKKLSPNRAIELNFIHEGKSYAEVDFSPVSDETHYKFKE